MVDQILLIVAIVLVGLHAGLLYDYSIDIVPSLRKLDPKSHIEMFQAIDTTITNVLFFPSFVGPIILLPLLLIRTWGHPLTWVLLGASVLMIVGSYGSTVVGNLPINAWLVAHDTTQLSESDARNVREKFMGQGSPWMIWHSLRTLSAVMAFVILVALGVLSDIV